MDRPGEPESSLREWWKNEWSDVMNREDRDIEVLVYQILRLANRTLLFDRYLDHDFPANGVVARLSQRETNRDPVTSSERMDLPAAVEDTDPGAAGKQDMVLIE